ncbi:hypothetical protein J6590_064000 [Homalodisca vitripennis]|nr:hypothetical protein J6590_064000 [Homalodisca vitripennis]
MPIVEEGEEGETERTELPSSEDVMRASKVSKRVTIVGSTDETTPEEKKDEEQEVKEEPKRSVVKDSPEKKEPDEKKKSVDKGSPEKKGAEGKKKGKKESLKQKKASVPKPPTPEPSIELTMSEEMIQKVIDDEEKIEKWNAYLDMVDDEVLQGLERAVECRSPSKSLSESSVRSKRRKTEELRINVKEGVILHTAQGELSKMGKRDASNILKDITSSLTCAMK